MRSWLLGELANGLMGNVLKVLSVKCHLVVLSKLQVKLQAPVSPWLQHPKTEEKRRKEDGARILQIGFAVASYCTNFVQSSDSTVEIENDSSKTKEKKTKKNKKKGKNLTLVY